MSNSKICENPIVVLFMTLYEAGLINHIQNPLAANLYRGSAGGD